MGGARRHAVHCIRLRYSMFQLSVNNPMRWGREFGDSCGRPAFGRRVGVPG
jgi:hypothetical protein